jgi:hypothetical protein
MLIVVVEVGLATAYPCVKLIIPMPGVKLIGEYTQSVDPFEKLLLLTKLTPTQLHEVGKGGLQTFSQSACVGNAPTVFGGT